MSKNIISEYFKELQNNVTMYPQSLQTQFCVLDNAFMLNKSMRGVCYNLNQFCNSV